MKHFCTAGPVKPDIHYVIPPTSRINRPEILSLIEQQKYFILHAPRQTGKTSSLLALMDELNAEGRYRALYINAEAGQAMRDDVTSAMRAILGHLAGEAKTYLDDPIPDQLRDEALAREGGAGALWAVLSGWAKSSPRPIILMIDEIDSLVGDTLISVLRQLRSGYARRPVGFPQTVILCGVRDLRDYRIHGTKEIITGGSAFNIKAESLRLRDFTPQEVRALYEQHTTETGQRFEEDVYPLVWKLTRGQPWLVNALAFEACFKLQRDRSQPVTPELIQQAKENLILRRETHLDQLGDKLLEKRVRRVIEPILTGADQFISKEYNDDTQYLIDLGLLRDDDGKLEIANAIYREVIPRELTYQAEYELAARGEQAAWYVQPDGRLDVPKLLAAFQQFFRENSESWLQRFEYQEAGPQLLMQAFLHRIVNGGDWIEREYALGRRRTDLILVWKHPGGMQRAVIELKVASGSGVARALAEGLKQTADYMDKAGTADGHLVIFDQTPGVPWEQKIFRRDEIVEGHRITVWGM